MIPEDELSEAIKILEKKSHEKDVEIANLRGYLDGTKVGYIIAKGDVMEIIKELPDLTMDIDSMTNFFTALTKVIVKIKALKPKE